MSSLAIGCGMFAGMLVSNLTAMWFARRLPDHHLSGESRDTIKLGLGVIGTLTALVLGLLVAATKGTFDAQSGTVKDLAAQVATLDRLLARYGPAAADARGRVRAVALAAQVQLASVSGDAPLDFSGGDTRPAGEALFDAVAALQPTTDSQRLLQARANDLTVGLGQLRQRLVVNSDRTIPVPLLVGLAVWQAVLFAGFGLIAPRNPTVVAVLVVCMASVAGALVLILELDRPFQGMIRVSDNPLRMVIAHLGE